MNKVEEISKNIVDKIEHNNGVKARLDTGYYSQKYCELKEMSAWKFGNMLANVGYCAVIEMLDRLKHPLNNENKFSPKEIAELMELIRGDLFKKAEETDRELR